MFQNLQKNTRESIPVRDELVLLWRSSYVNDPILHDLKEESHSLRYELTFGYCY